MTHLDTGAQVAVIGKTSQGMNTWLVISPGEKWGCAIQNLVVPEMPCPIVDVRQVPVSTYQSILDARTTLAAGVDDVDALLAELQAVGGAIQSWPARML